MSHRGAEGRRRQAAGGGTGGEGGIWLRAGDGGAVTATPRGGGWQKAGVGARSDYVMGVSWNSQWLSLVKWANGAELSAER